MNLHFVGDKLGKTIMELGEITPEELSNWLGYYKIQREEQDKLMQRNRRAHKSG